MKNVKTFFFLKARDMESKMYIKGYSFIMAMNMGLIIQVPKDGGLVLF